MKILIRLFAFIGLILLYTLGIFLVIFKGNDKLFDIYEYLMNKLN